MFFQRFYDTRLAQASYLIGCQRTGEAVVVDPNRDVQQYLDAAAAEGLRVTQVTETHIHADFVSGARGLTNVANLAGGYSAWDRAGLPVVRGDAERESSQPTSASPTPPTPRKSQS